MLWPEINITKNIPFYVATNINGFQIPIDSQQDLINVTGKLPLFSYAHSHSLSLSLSLSLLSLSLSLSLSLRAW